MGQLFQPLLGGNTPANAPMLILALFGYAFLFTAVSLRRFPWE